MLQSGPDPKVPGSLGLPKMPKGKVSGKDVLMVRAVAPLRGSSFPVSVRFDAEFGKDKGRRARFVNRNSAPATWYAGA
jgi:hypothetical protein